MWAVPRVVGSEASRSASRSNDMSNHELDATIRSIDPDTAKRLRLVGCNAHQVILRLAAEVEEGVWRMP